MKLFWIPDSSPYSQKNLISHIPREDMEKFLLWIHEYECDSIEDSINLAHTSKIKISEMCLKVLDVLE